MVDSYLSFSLWQQLLIFGLLVLGMTGWILGITNAVVAHKKAKLLKDCPYCEGTGKVTK